MPDMWFDVDTAITECPVNIAPLIDDTDFKTIEGAVAYNAAGMALFWHFWTSAGVYNNGVAVTPTTAGNYDWTDHGTHGIYTIEIPASGGASINNDTEGYGYFTGVATGVLPWRGPTIGFRAAGLNDLMCDNAYSTTRGLGGTAFPDAAAGASGGLHINGSNSGTTTYAAVTVTGSLTISDGLLVARSSANTSAITATGNGTGHGIAATSGSGATGDGIRTIAASTNGNGLYTAGTGSADGIHTEGGGTGRGVHALGGATSGNGVRILSQGGNSAGLAVLGNGSGAGTTTTGGATGNGATFIGGGTSGHGLAATVTSGNEIDADIVGAITGSLSGSVGSVTGAVGSVTGAVGSVTGAVGSVAGAVGSIAAGGITAASYAAGAIDAAALSADAGAEIAAAVGARTLSELTIDPGATPTANQAEMLTYMAIRNERITTATTDEISNSAGATILTAAVSDDGVSFVKAKYA